MLAVGEDLHYGGMVEGLADFRFAVEAVEKNRVAFHLRVGHFDSDLTAGFKVGGAENGGHAARSHHAFDLIVVELIPRVELLHAR